MTSDKEQITRLMQQVRESGGLPSSREIVAESFRIVGYDPEVVEPQDIIDNFGQLLREVWEATLPVLEMYEERSYAEGIPRELMKTYPEMFCEAKTLAETEGFRAGLIHLFRSWYPLLRRCFLSVSQSRMARGGKDFELQVEGLLDLGDVPYEEQEIQHRTDLMLPDSATYQRNKNIAAIVSVKRTLRERWAEVAEELFDLRSPNVFLFTADEDVTLSHVERICGDYNIHLVVWDSIKQQKFSDQPLVLGYTQWATERLAVLQQYW